MEQLKRALNENKVPHAYLFSGVEGIGKRRVAIGLAQSLNCLSVKNVPCEKCEACIKIEKGIHPDCHFIQPDGKTIKIEILRNLKQKIYLHPLEGKSKVVVIDKPEAITEAGANALLKLLEEPPSQTHFILISSQPLRLLPTIRSRCQKLEFSPLDEEEISAFLVKQGVVEAEAKQKAKYSGGSLSVAIHFDATLLEETRQKMEGLQSTPSALAIFELSDKWNKDEEHLPQIINILHHLWRQKWMTAQNEVDGAKLEHQWMVLQQASRGLEANANKQLLLENLLFTLTR